MDPPHGIAWIDAQAPLQRRIWRATRIAWCGMGLVLALAAAGLFGGGPLARAEAGAEAGDGALTVAYERFQRAEAPAPFVLRGLAGGAAGEALFCLDRTFLEEWLVERIDPAPLREEARGGDICHAVRLAGGVPSPEVTIRAMPRQGRLWASGSLYLPGGARVAFRAVVWP